MAAQTIQRQAASVVTFHFDSLEGNQWVCVPCFIRPERSEDIVGCVQNNRAVLEAAWGSEVTARVVDAITEGEDAETWPDCKSVGLVSASHKTVVGAALELLARSFAPGARIGGKTLFLQFDEPDRKPAKWEVLKRVQAVQDGLRIGKNADLGIWAVLPEVAELVIAFAEFGRQPGWLASAWERHSEEKKAAVARALSTSTSFEHISDTFVGVTMDELLALSAAAAPVSACA
jgi:hypothetical protein